MRPKTKQPPGSERARDEQRAQRGPVYGGEDWNVADERGGQRFGHARNDDADPLELVKPSAEDAELAATEELREIESGGNRAGMGRGETPRKPKSRAKRA